MSVRVLVVDDDVVIHKVLGAVLDGLDGFDCVGCASALALAEQHKPDLVLLDVEMKPEPGQTVLPKLRELEPRPIVLMVTSDSDPATVRTFLELGAKDYLLKQGDRWHTTLPQRIQAAWDRHGTGA
jgi:two-component system response regulator DcuR